MDTPTFQIPFHTFTLQALNNFSAYEAQEAQRIDRVLLQLSTFRNEGDEAQRGEVQEPSPVYLTRHTLAQLFDEIVATSWKYLLFQAFCIVKNQASAEDVLQESLWKAWKAWLKQYEETGDVRLESIRAWLTKIVRNTAFNYLQKEQRGRITFAGLTANLPTNHHPFATPSQEPEWALLRIENRAELLSFIEQLPEKQRQAVSLHYFDGWSEAAIAEKMQCPVNTVKSYLHRGISALRKAFNAQQLGRRDLGV